MTSSRQYDVILSELIGILLAEPMYFFAGAIYKIYIDFAEPHPAPRIGGE